MKNWIKKALSSKKTQLTLKNTNKMTQTERLLNYLKEHKTINPLESWSKLGIYRLSAAIHTLRKEHIIETDIVDVKNQFGETCNVANYVYFGEIKASL